MRRVPESPVNVYWEKAAAPKLRPRRNKRRGRGRHAGKTIRSEAAPASTEAAAPITQRDYAAPARMPTIPARPFCTRGKPADVARVACPEPPPEPAAQTGAAGNAPRLLPPRAETAEAAGMPPAPVNRMPTRRPSGGAAPARRRLDPQGRGAAFDFTEACPNYVCQEADRPLRQ